MQDQQHLVGIYLMGLLVLISFIGCASIIIDIIQTKKDKPKWLISDKDYPSEE